MLKILILEDDMNRIETFGKYLSVNEFDMTFVVTAAEAIAHLEEDEFDVVFLDHDLGGEVYVDTADKNTGSEVVRWLTRPPLLRPPVMIVHSMNTPAAQSMELALADDGYTVHRIPFPTLVTNYLNDPSFLR